MSDLKNLVFNHFLPHSIWVEATKLLDFQISLKASNRHLNTFNFFYFEKIQPKITRVKGKTYFNRKIGNNFFYGLTNEFFFQQYTVPKQGIGLRKFFFFSYPMQVLYYALGLYILKISEQFIVDNKKNSIKAFYGANLKFNSDGHLILKKNRVLYYDYYRAFKKQLTNEATNPANKVVIRLDIQNYFENVSIGKLLNLLHDNVKPSVLRAHHFDESTIELIHFYFRFLNRGGDCIPQSDNNVISNFISYLYLIFGDLIIEDILNQLNSSKNTMKDFKIVRYVDDIFIVIEFNPLSSTRPKSGTKARQSFIYQSLNAISDEFYRKLGLRFNDKARVFKIDDDDDKAAFLSLIKKVSENYDQPEAEETDPEDKFDTLEHVLNLIKERDISKIYEERDPSETETLKDVYDSRVEALISSDRTYRQRLGSIFQGFNFDLFRIYPQIFIILANKTTGSKTSFERFLLAKKNLTTFDRDLIIHHLCQNGFKNKKLIAKLSEDDQLEPIMIKFNENKVIDDQNTGYYQINFSKLSQFCNQISLIEQIRLRVYAERTLEYSVCLNHLLNEIQLICCLLACEDIKQYDALKVNSYLLSKRVPNTHVTKIMNLFDRRNNNPVSHPGSDVRIAWLVSESEYHSYKNHVGKALMRIL